LASTERRARRNVHTVNRINLSTKASTFYDWRQVRGSTPMQQQNPRHLVTQSVSPSHEFLIPSTARSRRRRRRQRFFATGRACTRAREHGCARWRGCSCSSRPLRCSALSGKQARPNSKPTWFTYLVWGDLSARRGFQTGEMTRCSTLHRAFVEHTTQDKVLKLVRSASLALLSHRMYFSISSKSQIPPKILEMIFEFAIVNTESKMLRGS